MSEMTPYFHSLERAADTACMVSETLMKHPGAKVQYHDQKFQDEIISGLDNLAAAVSGESAEPQSPDRQPTQTEAINPGFF